MITEKKLKNGIRVIYERIPRACVAAFGVWVEAGSAYERKRENGMSHMIEHMMFKGTKKRSAKEIADVTAMLGGNLNAYTGKECTAYYVRTPSGQLYEAMELISDMLRNSVFDEDTLRTEKQVVLDEIRMYDDSCEDMVHEKLQKQVWKKHPLGYIISGKKKGVRRFTREELLNFREAYYAGDRMVICAVGQFQEEELLEELENYFGAFPNVSCGQILTKPEYCRCEMWKRRDIEQVHLDMAFPCICSGSEERYIFALANSILGGSVSSRLFQRIREESGMAYSIYSYGSSFRYAGLWQIYAATNSDRLNEVLFSIQEAIRRLKEDGVTEEELYQAKRELRSELIMGNETCQSRMEGYVKSLLCCGRILSEEETEQRLMSVSRGEISSFLNRYLDIEQMSLCVMGNVGR